MARGAELVELFRRCCLWCGTVFGVCEPCYRGHRYCCEECREQASLEQGRQRDRRYRGTQRGREMNRDRQRRHRERKNVGVTDAASGAVEPSRS